MAPVGCGPFKFLEKKKDGTLILERFGDYYGGSPDNPPVQVAPLKHLIFKTIPDQAMRIARKQLPPNLTRLPVPAPEDRT